jgi:hypothetical protein
MYYFASTWNERICPSVSKLVIRQSFWCCAEADACKAITVSVAVRDICFENESVKPERFEKLLASKWFRALPSHRDE